MSDETLDRIKAGDGISTEVPNSGSGNSTEQRNDNNSGTRSEQMGVKTHSSNSGNRIQRNNR